MGLNDDGQMMAVADWVNRGVLMAELNAYRDGAPREYAQPITLWSMVVRFYVEQLEDHSAPGATFLESEPAVQLACVLDLMRRGAQGIDAMVEGETATLIADLEVLLSPGSEIDVDRGALADEDRAALEAEMEDDDEPRDWGGDTDADGA